MRFTENNPYGYWISKDEIIPVIDAYCHEEIAEQILVKRFNRMMPRQHSIYAVMFRLGYMRIVNEKDGHCVEHWKRARLSKLQKDFVKDAKLVEHPTYYGLLQ